MTIESKFRGVQWYHSVFSTVKVAHSFTGLPFASTPDHYCRRPSYVLVQPDYRRRHKTAHFYALLRREHEMLSRDMEARGNGFDSFRARYNHPTSEVENVYINDIMFRSVCMKTHQHRLHEPQLQSSD